MLAARESGLAPAVGGRSVWAVTIDTARTYDCQQDARKSTNRRDVTMAETGGNHSGSPAWAMGV